MSQESAACYSAGGSHLIVLATGLGSIPGVWVLLLAVDKCPVLSGEDTVRRAESIVRPCQKFCWNKEVEQRLTVESCYCYRARSLPAAWLGETAGWVRDWWCSDPLESLLAALMPVP